MPTVSEIPCPNCEQSLKVPESVFGKKIKCKHCGHPFVVRDPDEEPAKPAKGGKGVKPSKPGGASVKVKKEKEEPKPEPKPEQKPAPAAAPYKFEDDDDDDGAKPNPLGMIAEDLAARCPFCAQELDPPDAVICIHCGFNNVTRTQAESKRVWAPDANDWMNHLGPGIISLLICIGLIALDIVCLVNMRDWLTDTFLQKDDKGADGQAAFYVKPGAFITLIWAATVLPIIGTARFAIKRLLIDNKPMEKVKK